MTGQEKTHSNVSAVCTRKRRRHTAAGFILIAKKPSCPPLGLPSAHESCRFVAARIRPGGRVERLDGEFPKLQMLDGVEGEIRWDFGRWGAGWMHEVRLWVD
jgi:hypothetical protein